MKIDRIEVFAYRAPTPRPVATSFGVMRDRPAVFVKLTDRDGAFGWGEIFANWPAAGAEHRARLLMEDLSDLILGAPAGTPLALWRDLTARSAIRALQCGEPGPFAQVLAGVDTACSDMAARRAGLPLARWLNMRAAPSVPVYASGIASAQALDEVARARLAGIAAFKIKIGFDTVADLAALRAVADTMTQGERLFTDANQAWDVETALTFCDAARDLPIGWLEEPIRADAPAADWARMAAQPIALAGGENIAGDPAFAQAVAAGHLAYLQPDVAKWGGVSGCYGVARNALDAGRIYCPHFLGGGIGLLASTHLLAAAGGPGLLELDANPNPLRDAFPGTIPDPETGRLSLGNAVGLGIDALPDALEPYLTLTLDSASDTARHART
jgi:L-alanine-DL-glutamate epimerase-like enolase superfamily enzyme